MDAKLSSSFIPKQTLATASRGAHSSSEVNVLAIIAVATFLLVSALAGGVFLYHKTLQADLATLDGEIEDARSKFDLGRIDEVRALQRRIETAETVLGNHIAFSQFFDMLEANTVPQVAFRTLSFRVDDQTGEGIIQLDGVGEGFAAVALQSDAFLSRPELHGHTFGDFNLTKQGHVEFKYTARVAPAALSFTSLLNREVSTP